ncbi:MAG TPA: PEP-CTERM sorting domain-containing protein [Chthoniobacteraceae bacterium]|nr:PEP-CTERM sorting domain-containing protein [Chthoniobacteraceae bacterium]
MKPGSSYRLHFVKAALLLLLPASLHAQRVWNAGDEGDKDWATAENWVNSLPPTSSTDARFEVNPNSGAEVTVAVSGEVEARGIQVMLGKSVTLNLAGGAELKTTGANSLMRVGYSGGTGTGTGASHLIVNGAGAAGATFDLGQTQIGASGSAADGNTLTLKGNLTVLDSAGLDMVIGRFGNGQRLIVSDGADVTRHGIQLASGASSGGLSGNGISVTGEESILKITGGRLTVGDVGGAFGNFVEISDQATLQLNASRNLLIGNAAGTNLGGNVVEVGHGSTLKTAGEIQIHSHTVTGGEDTHGANRLTIESGGTLTSSSTIGNSGLLQLSEGATLAGKTLTGGAATLEVTTEAGGRFEAAGAGIGATVTSSIREGATLAVGITGADLASTLTLQSTVNLEAGSTLELTLFGSGVNDGIELVSGGLLHLEGPVVLSLELAEGYQPAAGDSWQLFRGNLAGISGDGIFDVTGYDPAIWDFSGLNADDGWRVAVIPEPGSVSLFLFSLAGGMAFWWRRRRVA